MCNPMALMVGGAAFQAVGAMNQAEAQKNAYEYQAQIARNNATIQQQNAKLAMEQGVTEEQNQRLKVASMLGDQRASMAANGLDLGEGTATDLLATTEFMGNRDALTIRDNASRKAWAYRVQGQNFLDDAAFKSATAGGINPLMAGATSLMGSATSFSDTWSKAKKSGTDLTKSFWS
jgi:hypothetical protein